MREKEKKEIKEFVNIFGIFFTKERNEILFILINNTVENKNNDNLKFPEESQISLTCLIFSGRKYNSHILLLNRSCH